MRSNYFKLNLKINILKHFMVHCKDNLKDVFILFDSYLISSKRKTNFSYFISVNKQKRRLTGDTSLMTYRGHSVLQTLIRCHFSPEISTGQKYIYTGCAQGRVVSKYN